MSSYLGKSEFPSFLDTELYSITSMGARCGANDAKL